MIGLSLALIGAVSGLITLGIRTCLKSNCTNVDICFGCVKYARETEENPEQLEIQPISGKI